MSDKGQDVDLTRAKQNTGVWLVKVPKYLSLQWGKASGQGEVGKLKIAKSQGKTMVSFSLNEELTVVESSGEIASSVRAPREHPFSMQSVGGQTLAVFTESSSDQITIEGMVVQRAECRPAVQESYVKLKKLQIEESTKPLRLSQRLDKAVTTNYKPVSNHSYNVEYEKKKREEGKRARADKEKVLEMLFSAFEKHQYYNIKNLVEITKQPVIYLKEILREIGVYNSRGPHKSTWELKPEYRHYQEGEEDEGNMD
ncbi:general transcription factor IIF subunit 2b [Colossoma macropomum]|uniref:general transcription factor IIF subunit 2b n=1 Tax=Colossoma macropomum TaxID=42526 RepID=UPI0018648095|nr:general transcription factor IIF subunit 2b [Colossoma macropomum]